MSHRTGTAPAIAPELKDAGLKSTTTRLRVLNAIRNAEARHLDADEIHRRLQDEGPPLGLATVYRVLSDLQQAGLLLRNVFDGGKAVYELDHGDHHDHLICLECGYVDEFSDPLIEARQQETARSRGFELADHRLALYGYCAACSRVRLGAATEATGR